MFTSRVLLSGSYDRGGVRTMRQNPVLDRAHPVLDRTIPVLDRLDPVLDRPTRCRTRLPGARWALPVQYRTQAPYTGDAAPR